MSSPLPKGNARDWRGRLQLLVVQPTPFCNLDCSYCYLPDRNNKKVMALITLETLARKVFAAGLPAPQLSVVWHAGEPLVVSTTWYGQAFATIARHCPREINVTHHFQTNGVLIDDRWCDFIQAHPVRIGVSIDGPGWLHDRHRKTRNGDGTHARVMKGIERLKAHSIPFHVICVLTRESLEHPDTIVDFFADLGCSELCFNIEEVEADHRTSSLQSLAVEPVFRAFFDRVIVRSCGTTGAMRVREIDGVLGTLRDPLFGTARGNSQNESGRILSVAWDGSFNTYSPELLGQRHPQLGTLSLGNVLRDDLVPAADHPLFERIDAEIREGIERCRAECKYFDFCGGGAPANKLGERDHFACTETMHCRLTQKAVTDCVLSALERDLALVDPSQRLLAAR
jgi:uncharacterized protein